jgi:V8-like Glu-specific endopeptidase
MINTKTFSGICYGIIFIALGADFAFAQETHKQTIQLQKPVVTQNQQLQKINPNTQLAPKVKADNLKIENSVLVKPPTIADRLKLIDLDRLQPVHPGVLELPDNQWVTYQKINANEAEITLNIQVNPDSLFGEDRNNYFGLLSRLEQGRERMRACTSAYESLKRVLPDIGNFRDKCLVTATNGSLRKPQSTQEKRKVLMCVEALEAYDKACLDDDNPIEEVPAVKWVSGVIYWNAKRQIRCGATLLNDRQVLAARHCFFEKGNQGFESIQPGEFRFISWSDQRIPDDAGLAGVALSGFQDGLESIENFQMDTDIFDYVVINLSSPYPRTWSLALLSEKLNHLDVSFGQPERFSVSTIGGFHRYPALISSLLYYLENGELLDDRDHITSNAWRDHFRADTMPTCVVGFTQRGNRCLLHACQTEGGMSGSAMFSFSGGDGLRQKLKVVGVHIRGLPVTGPQGSQCGASAPKGFVNLSVAPSTTDVAALNRNITFASRTPAHDLLAME